jgi:hypothetical protein
MVWLSLIRVTLWHFYVSWSWLDRLSSNLNWALCYHIRVSTEAIQFTMSAVCGKSSYRPQSVAHRQATESEWFRQACKQLTVDRRVTLYWQSAQIHVHAKYVSLSMFLSRSVSVSMSMSVSMTVTVEPWPWPCPCHRSCLYLCPCPCSCSGRTWTCSMKHGHAE